MGIYEIGIYEIGIYRIGIYRIGIGRRYYDGKHDTVHASQDVGF